GSPETPAPRASTALAVPALSAREAALSDDAVKLASASGPLLANAALPGVPLMYGSLASVEDPPLGIGSRVGGTVGGASPRRALTARITAYTDTPKPSIPRAL